MQSFAENFEFINILENSSPLEISGMTKIDDQLIVVSDNLEDTFFYGLNIENDKFSYFNYLDISTLKGYYPYKLKSYFDFHYPKLFKQQWDLEGLASCGNDIYFINEQHRHILKVKHGELFHIDIDLNKIYEKHGFPLGSYEANAGLEGIAVDCLTRTIYIAQEREPRAIYAFQEDKKELKVIFKPEADKKDTLNHDFADLLYENGYLYALDRNHRQIVKIDLSVNKIIKTISYEMLGDFNIKDLYKITKPYGLVEAMYFEKETIILGVDNNYISFTEKAKQTFGFNGKNSVLIYLKRPKDF